MQRHGWRRKRRRPWWDSRVVNCCFEPWYIQGSLAQLCYWGSRCPIGWKKKEKRLCIGVPPHPHPHSCPPSNHSREVAFKVLRSLHCAQLFKWENKRGSPQKSISNVDAAMNMLRPLLAKLSIPEVFLLAQTTCCYQYEVVRIFCVLIGYVRVQHLNPLSLTSDD